MTNKRYRIILAITCLLFLNTGMATSQEQKITLKVQRRQQAIPVSDVTSVGGFAGDRISKNKDNYLKVFPIDEHVRFLEERTYKDWDWKKAEQPGKWIESAILTSKRTGDQELKDKVNAMYNRLLASQEPEGYIGATSKTVRTPEKPLRGMDAYELYFLQHALMTAYEQWNDPKGLEAARKMGDYFIKYIGPGKAEFWPSKEKYPDNVGKVYRGTVHSALAGHSLHYSWEGTQLIDPMLRLYKLTGDKRYLDWCNWVIGRIDQWSGWNAYSKLDSVADGTLDIDKIQPYVHSHTFQMNFLGFLRMYQISGDTSFLRKVRGAWDDVAERQMYITGGVSVGEHYERDYIKPLTGKMVETCASMSWMELSQYLLELTNDTKYADAMERLFWNHIFAAQSIDGDGNRYNTPPNGVKPDGIFREPDCCTASGHRLMSLLPKFIYATGENAVFVNQFVKSEASVQLAQGGKISLSQVTSYPEENKVIVAVNPEKQGEFTVHIRVPAWCASPKIMINGKAEKGIKPGTYAALTRTWKAGDKIEITLPMELKWVRREHHMDVQDRKPYVAKPDANPPYALLRGPVVYALDNIWYNGPVKNFPVNVMDSVSFILSDPSRFKMVKSPGVEILGPGYIAPVQLAGGKRTEIILYPFANIGKWYKDKNNKPHKDSAAYSYAIWLKGVGK
jgi:DUF1680 family protein